MSGARDWRCALTADRMTVGKSDDNDVPLPDDATASHLHAVLERFPAGWCVADLGSSNGTWLNGSRIWSSQRLRHGDEIRVGQTRLIFRDFAEAQGARTEAEDAPPSLTGRERDVLVALCRPLLAPGGPGVPATNRQIADELHLSLDGVKTHIRSLFAKLAVDDLPQYQKRTELARRAVALGLVGPRDAVS